MSRIGLFGGSFSPVHNGHLRLAEFARSEFNLERVFFIPSNRTPLKRAWPYPASLRLRCLRRALRGKKAFTLSDCEVRRGGASYTVDTLKAFRKKFPKATLYFLTGADNAAAFSRWKSPAQVLKLCRFVILSRPGAPRKRTPSGALWADFPALDISSSEVRRRLRRDLSLEGLVPPGVERILRSRSKRK